jgi:hypothetical protein
MKQSFLKVLVCSLLLATLGQAQVAPEAAQLLEEMRQAHGGQALRDIRAYQEVATLTLFSGPQPQARLSVTSFVDFQMQRIKVEYRAGPNLVQAILFTPEGGQVWTPEAGKRALEPGLAKDFKDSFYQSWYGLRFGGAQRELARLEGLRTFGEVRGRAIVVRTQGTQTTYLVDERNRIVAEAYTGSLGEFTAYYNDLRSVSGIQIPFKGSVYVNGILFGEIQVQEARVNPTVGPETFKLP